MPTATTPLILPSEALRELRSGGVYTAKIPVEHAKSILVPTLRLGFPAYAFFSAPTTVGSRSSPRPTPSRWAIQPSRRWSCPACRAR